jgi:hypothetical protein
MKKILSFILAVVCVLCFFTVNVSAQSYSVDDTDVSITVDSKEWKVFTRKNVSGNSELKSMGISPQYFYDAMINTNVYLEMFRVKENSRETIEFKIYKENNTDINNYKNLSERKLRKIGEGLSAKRSADSWKLYSSENPYIYMEYSDIEYNYVEYYTVVNQEVYRLVASKANKFSDAEKESIRGIVDSAEYKINSLYANESGFQKFWAEYAIQTVVVIILIGVVIGAVVLFKKRKTIKKVIKSTKPPKPSAPKAPQPRVPQPPKPKKPADATMVTIDRTKRKSRKK